MTPNDPSGTALKPAESHRGVALLHDPLLNKGTAFTDAERDALGLRGLLPPRVSTQEEQARRVLENFRRLPTRSRSSSICTALHDRNEALFFRVLIEISRRSCRSSTRRRWASRASSSATSSSGRAASSSAPTTAAVCRRSSRNWPSRDARMIVVTDGERILGLGDLGANGMGIPVGKLALYTGCAGIHPIALPAGTLDVGTNNGELLADPFYVGLRQRRVRGEAYDALVDEFIDGGARGFPGRSHPVRGFRNHNAFRLLDRYRERMPTFNDDIQGTAAVALAGLFSALRVTGGKLADQKILFLGAGEAAIGIADLIVSAMTRRACPNERPRALLAVRLPGPRRERPQPISRDHKRAVRARPRADRRFPDRDPDPEADRDHRRGAVGGTSHGKCSRTWRGSTSARSCSRFRIRPRSRSAPPKKRIAGRTAARCSHAAARSIR